MVRILLLTALSLCALTPAAPARSLVLYITNTTYIDSRVSNQALNYGHAHTVKAVIDSYATSDGSMCRGLLQLPAELWSYPPQSVRSATVRFYVWQDNTEDRNITLFPMARPFVPGTSYGASPADGATWLTYDGTNAWASPGGDFDTSAFAAGVKEEVLNPDMNDRFFSWDITALLHSPASRAELQSNGAMLRIDELPPPATGMPRAPFTSCYDPSYSTNYWPALELEIAPSLLNAAVTNGVISFNITDLTSGTTNTIERSPDLSPGSWTEAAIFVAADIRTNWSERLPAGWAKGFYRLRSPQ